MTFHRNSQKHQEISECAPTANEMESMWNDYPLPTLVVLRKSEKILFANKAFCAFFDTLGENLSDLLDTIILDDSQRNQCSQLLKQRMHEGRLYWCPLRLQTSQCDEVVGVLQVWRYWIDEQDVRVLHFLSQPTQNPLEMEDFSPEKESPPNVGDVLHYFSSAAHAAYNLWLLLDRMSEGIVLVDNKGRIFGVNQVIKDRYGYSSSKVDTIWQWWEMVHFSAEDDAVLREAISSERSFGPLRTKIMCDDGSRRSVLVEFITMSVDWRSFVYEDISSPTEIGRDTERLLRELHEKTEKIQDLHIAIKVLLEQGYSRKKEFDSLVQSNVAELVLPLIDKLEGLPCSDTQKKTLKLLREQFDCLTSLFTKNIDKANNELSPREHQIAHLLVQGKTTKEIADTLCISPSAVGYYRNILRRKIGIVDQKVNLKTRLRKFVLGNEK